jgi:type IV pilus assembly protein PilC
MPKYSFKARNAAGGLVEGARVTSSEKELVSMLRNEGLIVFSVGEVRDRLASTDQKGKKVKKGGNVKYQEIAIFCRQLATLINAGVSILDAIEDVSEMVTTQKFQKILKTAATDIREGATLSDAMRKHQKVFGKVFIALISAGEKSGQVGQVLMELATYQEGVVKLRRKIKSASSYPLFIAAFFGVAIIGLVFFLIPRFQSMFESFGAELPFATRVVVGISNMMLHNAPIVVLLAGGAVGGMVMVYRTAPGRLFVDRFLLNMPIFGDMITKIVFARFFQTLATLLKSGTDIISSLEIASRTADNMYVEKIIETIKDKVVEGSTMSDEMGKEPIFPAMVVRMTAIGEKSGKLDEMFVKLSDYYSDEVDAIVAAMSSIIEPVLIVALGFVVGIFVVTMYLPIFKMAAAMVSKQ